jgi:hypothetical protein
MRELLRVKLDDRLHLRPLVPNRASDGAALFRDEVRIDVVEFQVAQASRTAQIVVLVELEFLSRR